LAESRKRDEQRLIRRLIANDTAAWSEFVDNFSGAIFGAVVNTLRKAGYGPDESTDVAQDVFVRLCKDNHRLLKQFDPDRASLKTWLGVVASSTTIDHLRRLRGHALSIDDMPEDFAVTEPRPVERITVPVGLLSDRQALILKLLYEKDMDAADVADMLGIDSQTVRSTHHKALVKLRKYFGREQD
jgi:RNA polymerase sigma-70 factor (ECF subfamily)